jgi:Ornithine cyclodeaminase/mu-crystallin family
LGGPVLEPSRGHLHPPVRTTVFKSVGIAIEDVAAARLVYELAWLALEPRRDEAEQEAEGGRNSYGIRSIQSVAGSV